MGGWYPSRVIVRGTRPFVLKALRKKGFGGGHVTLTAQAEIDCLAVGIQGAIEVHPAAIDVVAGTTLREKFTALLPRFLIGRFCKRRSRFGEVIRNVVRHARAA
jgi:hypothetical protein